MCIIIHKPKGKSLDLATLKRCWDRNPHGAGFMFTNNGAVYGNKGYMKFEELIGGLTGSGFFRRGKLTGKHAVTIHFRLASHGSIKPSNCHPFPVTNDLEVVKAKYWEADCGVAHNGIINIECDKKLDISDTMTYVIRRLAEIYDRLSEPAVYRKMAQETAGSRMFVLYPDGSYVLSGEWVEEGGVLYSNMGFKADVRRPQARKVSKATSAYDASQQEYLQQGFVYLYHNHRDWVEEMQAKAGTPRHAPPGMKWPKR